MDICKWLEFRAQNFPLVPTYNCFERYSKRLKEEKDEKAKKDSDYYWDFAKQHIDPYYHSLDSLLIRLYEELNSAEDFVYTFREMAATNDLLYRRCIIDDVERSFPDALKERLSWHILLRSAMAGGGYSSSVIRDAMKLEDIKSNSVLSKKDIQQFLETNNIDKSFFEHMLNRIYDLNLEVYERGEDERKEESVIKNVSKSDLVIENQGYHITAMDYFPSKLLEILSQ